MKSFNAGKNEDTVRISRFVQSVTKNIPSSLLYKSFRNKRIKINGKGTEPDYRICEGDLIELYINDEFFESPKSNNKQSEQSKITIIYEDENIAILDKPAHMLCHSDKTGDNDLASAFAAYLSDKGEYDKDNEKSFTPALCNRLDRGTRGIVLAGKSYKAVRDLNEIIRDDKLIKSYLCLSFGNIKKGRYTAYLKHNEKDNKVEIKPYLKDGYKNIITDIKPIKTIEGCTLYEIGLVTGRTHQIRAHMAFLNSPILGDKKYGNKKLNERYGFKTQALCSYKIVFKKIPAENTLSYLSEKIFDLDDKTMDMQKISQWNLLCK